MLQLLQNINVWGQILISLLPLATILLYVIKSFQLETIDLVFMKKERKTFMSLVQCTMVGCGYGFYVWVFIQLKIVNTPSLTLFIGSFYICIFLFLLIVGIYFIVVLSHHKFKNKIFVFVRKRLTSTVFNIYFIVSFTILLLASGLALILLAITEIEQVELTTYIVVFSIMIAVYMEYSVKVSKILSPTKVWIALKQYPKLYLLYEFDENTILCEIPSANQDIERQYVRILKTEIAGTPLHIENINDKS